MLETLESLEKVDLLETLKAIEARLLDKSCIGQVALQAVGLYDLRQHGCTEQCNLCSRCGEMERLLANLCLIADHLLQHEPIIV